MLTSTDATVSTTSSTSVPATTSTHAEVVVEVSRECGWLERLIAVVDKSNSLDRVDQRHQSLLIDPIDELTRGQ
jgi:hypothetical protein